jgi:hypothetical protein
MKSNLELLNMYKEEKALVIGDLDSRTGLEPFETFAEWKSQYISEYNESHDVKNPISMEDAVALVDEEIDDDGELLSDEDLKALKTKEEVDMSDEVMNEVNEDGVTELTDPMPAVEVEKPKRAKRAPKATKAEKPAKAKSVTKPSVKKEKAFNKAAEARKVFNRLYPQVVEGTKARKDVIAQFTSKCQLSPAGASTYYQKFKAQYQA